MERASLARPTEPRSGEIFIACLNFCVTDGLVVTAFIVFAFCWNEALFASAVTTQNAVTMPAFILASRDTQGIRFNFAAVNTIIAISAPVLLSLFVQRYLARGLSFGAVKA